MSKEWYKEWFSSDEYLNVYNHRNNEDARMLLEMILLKTSISKEANILDAACGAGRHSISLSESGFKVTGFDLSLNLLKKAKSDSLSRRAAPDLFCADIRNVPIKGKFDLILNLFTSFGYFDADSDNFQFVKDAHNMLNRNGWYVLDYFNSRHVINNLVPFSERIIGKKKITEKRFIEEGRVKKDISIECDGSVSYFNESVKLYEKDKIVSEFENIGFSFKECIGDYSGGIFDKEGISQINIIL